ncbi:MAG: hypothetical protein J7513_07140 [Solirubrobacteraceae bacterium]|nr:hypothetical protein [Solirubrobacteraceae bacterium]
MGLLDDAIREHLELKRRRGADGAEVSRQEREILGSDGAPEGSYDAPAADLYEDPIAATDPAYAEDAEGIGYADPAYDEVVPEPPLAGSPLTDSEAPADPAGRAPSEIFPGTGELMAAAAESAQSTEPPAAPAPAPAAESASAAAERTGARRLSDEELAAWRKRLSERADRLAAGRPVAAAGAAASDPASAASPAPARPTPPASDADAPPAYWSGNTAPPAPATPAAGAAQSPPPAADEAAPGVPVDFFDAGDAASAFSPEPAPEPVSEAEGEHDVLDETPEFLQETPEHDRMWFEQRPPRDFDFG